MSALTSIPLAFAIRDKVVCCLAEGNRNEGSSAREVFRRDQCECIGRVRSSSPLRGLVRLLKLPVASRGSLHVRRGVVLFDGFSISGKRKLGAVSTMPPTIQMSMRRDLLWIVHISVFSLGRIVDPWMCLVIHTVPFCLFFVSRTCTSRRAESNSATTERIFDSLAKFPMFILLASASCSLVFLYLWMRPPPLGKACLGWLVSSTVS